MSMDKEMMMAEIATLKAQLEAQKNGVSTMEVSDYKGNPVAQFSGGNFRPFSMGIGKCRAILNHTDELGEFVKANTKN